MANTTEFSDIRSWIEHLDVVVTEKAIWVHVLYTAVMSAVFVVGVCGNLLTCVVIHCDRSMHTATNFYLFNLAVTDLFLCFGILLELKFDGFMNYPYDFNGLGDWLCKAHFFFIDTLWNIDVLIITALAIERYVAIFYPLLLDTKPTWKRLRKIIVLIWFIAITETLSETWNVHLIRSTKFSICSYEPTTTTRWITGVLSLVTFVIPFGVMVFVYTMVALKVKTSQSRLSQIKIFNHRNNSSKVNRLVMALTISFLVCWFPFFVLRILVATDTSGTWFLKNWDAIMILCSFTGWFSVVVNPLVFSLMSTKFRKALKTLWNTNVRRQQRNRSLTNMSLA